MFSREFAAVAAREIIGRGGPGGERDVHEVGRAAHHAAGGARPVQHHHAARFQFLAGARDDERQADAVAGGGRGIGHLVAVLRIALHVVERGDRARAAGEAGMRGHVLDAFAAAARPRAPARGARSGIAVPCVPAWRVSLCGRRSWPFKPACTSLPLPPTPSREGRGRLSRQVSKPANRWGMRWMSASTSRRKPTGASGGNSRSIESATPP